MRKVALVFIILTSLVFAKPELKLEVFPIDPENSGYSVRVSGNAEVKTVELMSPIDPQYYRKAMNQYFFYWPPWLPDWPGMYFIVNGKEIHHVRELTPPNSTFRNVYPFSGFKV